MRCLPTIALLSFALFALPAAAAPPKKGETYKYRIVPGDTCWNIAIKLFGNGRKYKMIHKYNQLGPMPHILKPGKILMLPRSGNIPTARLEWMKKEVKAKPPNAIDWLKARRNMSLWKLYKVTTGDNSSAGIRFEDRSFLKMRERALLVIYGGSKALARTNRLKKNTVVLERGIVKGGLAGLLGKKSLTIKTPSSEMNIWSKLVQIEVTKDKKSIVSVFQGKVNVKAKGKKVTVPANHGTTVELGKKPAKPRRLPARPKWKASIKRLVVFAPSGHTATFSATWLPVRGAKKYHVELARNPRFKAPMIDAVVGAGIMRLRARDLKPAKYFARISAIDSHKLEGKPSTVLQVAVVALESTRQLRRNRKGTYETAGILALRPPAVYRGQTEIAMNGGAFRRFTEPVRLTKPGIYSMKFRFRGESGSATSQLAVRLLAVKGTLSGPTEAIHVKGGAVPITLTLQTERGGPITLPNLTLRAYPGGVLKLVLKSAGRYQALLPAPTTYSAKPIKLWASWLAGDLAQLSISIRKPPKPKIKKIVIPAFAWLQQPPALVWGNTGLSYPSQAARPMNRVSVQTALFTAQDASGNNKPFLRLAISGTVALVKQRLGLDLDLPLLQMDLKNDTSGRSKFGDMQLGLRYLALDASGWLLTPTLRVSFPSGRFPRFRDDYVIEVGAILQKSFNWFTLNTNQRLATLIDSGSGVVMLHYVGSVAGLFRVHRYFSFGVEADWLLGLVNHKQYPVSSRLLAVTAGGVFRLQLSRFRLSLNGGAPLRRTGRSLRGEFTVGLTFDVGFKPF